MLALQLTYGLKLAEGFLPANCHHVYMFKVELKSLLTAATNLLSTTTPPLPELQVFRCNSISLSIYFI